MTKSPKKVQFFNYPMLPVLLRAALRILFFLIKKTIQIIQVSC